MIRAAVLVPAPDYPEDWEWAFDVEAAALQRGGIIVEARPWSDPGDLTNFDLVLPLVAWGYHFDPKRWLDLLDRLESLGAVTVNPVPLLRWNSDKAYLEELGAKGIATVPTALVGQLDMRSMAEARDRFGGDLVIKPPISASAYGTHRIGPADPLPAEVIGRTMMVQPFLRSVMDEGEYSLMLFDGELSHSIIKRPTAGDYRTQPHLGGTEIACPVPDGALEVARAALGAAPVAAAYARVDLIRLDDGALGVIELELIEPSLWLQHAPDQGASFAAAIAARAR
ncbi:MAG: hypothetical protein V4444_01710 [Pseudomonadota bacterium]